jgi:hypothetical protein
MIPRVVGINSTLGAKAGLALIAALAIAVCGFTAPAAAKKSSKTAPGGPISDAISNPTGADIPVPFVQEFKFKGRKFKGRKVSDVSVTVNAFGNGAGSNAELSAILVDPRGDADTALDPKGGSAPLPLPKLGNSMLNLAFRDTSLLIPCNPFDEPRFNCNYLQGASEGGGLGTMTGELNAVISSQFEGKGARGTWKLVWRDALAGGTTTTLGPATLTLQTTKKK